MRDQEFFPRVREYSSPGEEVSRPGREWNAGGREYGQTNGDAAPARKRRRIPLAVVAATVVVTGAVMAAAPAAGPSALPQPENFTEEYRAYLDQLMTACETKDEPELHRLATSDMASEIWAECLESYYYEMSHPTPCYDGEKMSLFSRDAPALYFYHAEDISKKETGGYPSYTSVRYYDDSRIWQGVHYSTSYAQRSGGAQKGASSAPPTEIFWGRFVREDMSKPICYLEGIYRKYNIYGYISDTQDSFHLDRTLEGQFTTVSEEEQDVTYLENGTLTVYNGDEGVEIEVRDGRLQLEDNPNVAVEWFDPYGYIFGIYSQGHSMIEWCGAGESETVITSVEDLQYHNTETKIWR